MNANPYALKIAHIGPGIGLCLLDLQQFLTKRLGNLPPSLQLDNYDIDASSSPSSTWLPANISIKQISLIDSEVPASLHDYYDVIHLSNLAAHIKDNSPDQLVKNVMSMLSTCHSPLSSFLSSANGLPCPTEPGGWMQWHEPDTANRCIVKNNLSLPSPRLEALLRLVSELETHRPGPRGWINSLPDILARYGLEVPVGDHRYRMSDVYTTVETDRFLLEMEDFARVLDGEREGGGEDLRGSVKAAAEECACNGLGVRTDMVVAVARKEGGER
ncbi:MAG: hypothetical protein Q9184_007431 [Pyrenodesmia sp. 2 TL-2023]